MTVTLNSVRVAIALAIPIRSELNRAIRKLVLDQSPKGYPGDGYFRIFQILKPLPREGGGSRSLLLEGLME